MKRKVIYNMKKRVQFNIKINPETEPEIMEVLKRVEHPHMFIKTLIRCHKASIDRYNEEAAENCKIDYDCLVP